MRLHPAINNAPDKTSNRNFNVLNVVFIDMLPVIAAARDFSEVIAYLVDTLEVPAPPAAAAGG